MWRAGAVRFSPPPVGRPYARHSGHGDRLPTHRPARDHRDVLRLRGHDARGETRTTRERRRRFPPVARDGLGVRVSTPPVGGLDESARPANAQRWSFRHHPWGGLDESARPGRRNGGPSTTTRGRSGRKCASRGPATAILPPPPMGRPGRKCASRERATMVLPPPEWALIARRRRDRADPCSARERRASGCSGCAARAPVPGRPTAQGRPPCRGSTQYPQLRQKYDGRSPRLRGIPMLSGGSG
jgi:hypothetical protein